MQSSCVCCDSDGMRVASQVHRIAVKLSSNDKRMRRRAAAELRVLSDMTLGQDQETLQPFQRTLQDALQELTNNKTVQPRLGAAYACLELGRSIHLEDQQAAAIHRIIYQLLDTSNLTLAATSTEALCAIIQKSCVSGEIVEAECQRCREWLSAKKDKLFTACLILKGLSLVAGSHMVPHVTPIMKDLYSIIKRTDNEDLLTQASEATSAMASYLLQHDTLNGQHAVEGFCAMLLGALPGGTKEREQRGAITILCHLVSKLPPKLVNATTVTAVHAPQPAPLVGLLISRIAEMAPARFTLYDNGFTCLKKILAKHPKNVTALKALQGLLSSALQVEGGAATVLPHVDVLLPYVQGCDNITSVTCLTMLLKVRPEPKLSRFVLKKVSELKSGDRGLLLADLAMHLNMRAEVEGRIMQLSLKELDSVNTATVIGALRDLAHLSFKPEEANLQFFTTFVVPCGRSHKSPEVRCRAHLTCLAVLQHFNYDDAILKEIVTSIMCDLDIDNRVKGIKALGTISDLSLLSEKKCARALCIGLMDVNSEVRKLSTKLLCKLCAHNPPAIAIKLGNHLKNSHHVLENYPCVHHRAEAAYMIGLCYVALKRADQDIPVDPSKILTLYLKGLKECLPSSMLQSSLLRSLGLIAEVEWALVDGISQDVIPLLVNVIQKQDLSQCTEPAVSALRRVLQCSGGAFAVFKENTGLFGRLQTLLHHSRGAGLGVRLEVMRLVGVLGAVEPSKSRRLQLSNNGRDFKSDVSQKDFSSAWSSIAVLLDVLNQPWHSSHHDNVAQSVRHVLKLLGPRRACLQVPRIAPVVLGLLQERSAKHDRCPVMWSTLAYMIGISGVAADGMQPHVSSICNLILERWFCGESTDQVHMASIVSSLHITKCNVVPYLDSFIPRLSDAAVKDRSVERVLATKACAVFEDIREVLRPYMHTATVCLMSLLTGYEQINAVKMRVLQTISSLSKTDSLGESSVLVAQALMQQLSLNETVESNGSLKYGSFSAANNASFGSVTSAKSEVLSTYYTEVAYTLREILDRSRHTWPLAQAARDILRPYVLDDDLSDAVIRGAREVAPPNHQTSNPAPNVAVLREHLRVKPNFTHSDFMQWFDRLCLTLLKESTRSVLRAVATPAAGLPIIARSLLNVSFAVCHRDLQYDNPDVAGEMLDSLQDVLQRDVPEDVLRPLLELSDYLERFSMVEERLDPSVNPSRLLRMVNPSHQAHLAENCGLHTKALRLAECCDISEAVAYRQLVRVNVHLGLPEAAEGIMRMVQKSDIEDAEMYADLGLWTEALVRYEAQLKTCTVDTLPSVVVGMMTALDKKGDWQKMLQCVDKYWAEEYTHLKECISPMVTHGAWIMSKWDLLEDASSKISDTVISTSTTFYKAVLAVQRDNLTEAARLVDQCRREIDANMVASSYHAYSLHVTLQHLTGIEEMIEYKTTHCARRRDKLKLLWNERQGTMQMSTRHMQDALTLRSLVIPKQDDLEQWVRFAVTSHKLGQTDTAVQVLNSLQAEVRADEMLKLATYEIQWDTDPKQRPALFKALQCIVSNMKPSACPTYEECCLTLSTWGLHLERPLRETLDPIRRTTAAHGSYKSWNQWALLNLRIVFRGMVKEHEQFQYVEESIKGFSKCIELSTEDELLMQDAMRLLHLANKYLDITNTPCKVNNLLKEAILAVKPSLWSQLIPQVVTKLSTPKEELRDLTVELCKGVADADPQVVLFHLLVEDCVGAKKVLKHIMKTNKSLVEEAMAVSKELIRVTISWEEKWIGALAKMHALFSSNTATVEKVQGMLNPLYELLLKARTAREHQFITNNLQKLKDAQEALVVWSSMAPFGNPSKVKQNYIDLWRTLHESLATALDLKEVSPKLAEARNLLVGVPGKGFSNEVMIHAFEHNIPIILSVQRPRKLSIVGSDGLSYRFLLKGNEDLRLDERIMQLLGMANTLLKKGSIYKVADIIVYPVVPIAHDVGLIGWVDDAEDLERVITLTKQDKQKDIEMHVVAQHFKVPKVDWDTLSHERSIEALKVVEAKCPGDILQLALWLRAATSEVWFERRTAFTQSLAVMSMLGYLIGLGDRHLGNILLHGPTGRIAHIDFGECFEAATERKLFPECVPFRLTRQLRNAMGVGGAEGVFRRTAIVALSTLRNVKQSILVTLESFVYDPLIQGKLQEDGKPQHIHNKAKRIIHRVQQKLDGSDTHPEEQIPVKYLAPPPVYPANVYKMKDHGKSYIQGLCNGAWSVDCNSFVSCVCEAHFPASVYVQKVEGLNLQSVYDRAPAVECRVMCMKGHQMAGVVPAPVQVPVCSYCSGAPSRREGQYLYCSACDQHVCPSCIEDTETEYIFSGSLPTHGDDVVTQVDRLICEATDPHRLAKLYKGWRPWL